MTSDVSSPNEYLGDFGQALDRKLRSRLRQREAIYTSKIRAHFDEAIRTGNLGGSRFIMFQLESLGEEFEERVRIALACLVDTAEAFGPDVHPDVTNAIKAMLFSLLQENYEETHRAVTSGLDFEGNSRIALQIVKPFIPRLNERIEQSLKDLENEITIWSRKRQNVAKDVSKQINVHGDYIEASGTGNIIQTRAVSSTATLTFDTSTRQQLDAILVDVRRKLESSNDIDARTKADTLEVIDDCAREIQKEEPNLTRVKSFLSGIAGTIQTIGSMGDAWTNFKEVLKVLGIEVG